MREDKTNFKRVFVFAIITLLISMMNFAARFVNFKSGLTGFSIQENIVGLYNQISPISKIFLVLQFAVLAFVLVFLAYKRKKIDHLDNEIKDISKWKRSQNGTDLDVLYDILKEKKQLKITSISESFKVNKDIALEWAKILEAGNLATLHYPGFGDPELKLLSSIDQKKVNLYCPPNKLEVPSSDNKIEDKKVKDEISKDRKHEKPKSSLLSIFSSKKVKSNKPIVKNKPKSHKSKLLSKKDLKFLKKIR